MSSSSQDFQFLDLSGVDEEDRQQLLTLFSSDNPAVLVLAREPPSGFGKCPVVEDPGQPMVCPTPPVHPPLVILAKDVADSPPNSEPNSPEATEGDYMESVPYLTDGGFADENKGTVMSVPATPPQTTSITSSIATTTTTTSSALATSGTEVATLRSFNVPPPTVVGQTQLGVQPGVQQSGQQVYQPYPPASPNNPPLYNPHMPPPSHHQPPPANVYTQLPPPSVLPHGATVYVANCHVNLSPYGSAQAQVPVLPSNGGPSQSPPAPTVIQSVPMMPDQTPVHVPPVKPVHEGKPEYENKRYEFQRTRGRGGRGRGSRGRRISNERSNSVSSDHSSYGGEKHYPEMGPPPPYGHMHGQYMYSNMQYPVRGSGYPQYSNVPAAQTVQGLPLMYSQQHQYSPYMPYPSHSQGMIPFPQQPVPPGPHHQPTLQPVHHQSPHQPPHPTHHPQPPHYSHHADQQHMQDHPHQEDQQYPVQPPEPPQQINYTEVTEIPNAVEAQPGQPMLSISPHVENTSAVVSSHSVEYRENVALHDAEESNLLVTQTSAMSLEEEVEPGILPPAVMNVNQEVPVEEEQQDITPVQSVTEDLRESGVPQMTQQPQDSPQIVKPPHVQLQTVTPVVQPGEPVVSQQMPPPPVTELVNESHRVAPLTLHTSLSEITFMSDEIQPNVDPQESIDFVSDPKLGLISPSAVSPVGPGSYSYMVASSSNVKCETEGKLVHTPSAERERVVVGCDGGAPITAITASVANPALSDTNKKELMLADASASPAPGGAWAQKKSWSQFFKPSDEGTAKQVAYVTPFSQDVAKSSDDAGLALSLQENKKQDPPMTDAEIDKAKIGGLLREYRQNYHHVALQPRGLINKGYWCYVNAPLQALLACPPFYNLMKALPNIAGLKKGKSTTPVIDSIVEYVHEFSDLAPMLKTGKKEKGNPNSRKESEIVTGTPFEPCYIYKMLATMNGDMFTEGRQQDAEEMLSAVLNGLHDEMVEALKLAGENVTPLPSEDHSVNGSVNGDFATSDTEEMSDTESDEWQMMGPRKRCIVTRTAHFTPSPISAIFWGKLRSVLHQAGGHTTANLQPFTTLPLDIQSPKVESVTDALEQLVSREEIPDYTCSKTNQEVTVCKQVVLEHLPPVLILQLKRFIYDKDGGLQKVVKKLNFPIDLEITKELMSSNSRGKFSALQKKYKLLAVVYHDGKEATKGHYIADIYHSGYSCWLRFDDNCVKPVSDANVLRHVSPRVPYLLFYRRGDTMVGPVNKLKT